MERIAAAIDRTLDRWDSAIESNPKRLLLLLAIPFLLKLLYVLESSSALFVQVPLMDSKYYDDMAREIAGGRLVRREAFFMGPLYPYFLSVVYSTIGHKIFAVRLLQILGGTGAIALTYLLGRRLFRPSTAAIGAGLLALYGTATFYEGQMLMTWLGTVLNLGVLLLLLGKAGEGVGSLKRFAFAGALLGLSALARANVLAFMPVVILWLLTAAGGERRPRITRAVVFTVATLVVTSVATIHNYAASRDFVPVTSNVGLNFYLGNNPDATGIFAPPDDVDFVVDTTTREYIERLLGRDLKPSEVSRYWAGRSWTFIRQHPFDEIRLLLRKTALFCNGFEIPQIESYDVIRARYPSLQLLFVNFWILNALGLIGMVMCLRTEWKRYFVPVGFVVVYALTIILFFITARYRVQIVPILAIFAAHALVVKVPLALRTTRAAAMAAVVLALILLPTHPGIFALDDKEVAYREHIHEGRRTSKTGEYTLALKRIDQAVELMPDHAEAYVHRAIIHKEARNLFKAVEDYTRALDIDPRQYSVHYDLAQALRQLNMFTEAERSYLEALRLNPLMISAYNNLGITYRDMKKYGLSIEYFRKVIEMDPHYVKAYNNLGASLAEGGQVDEAILTFKQAIEVDPVYANSYKNLAMAYISRRRTGEAVKAMERYVGLSPNDQQAVEVLGKLRVALEADSLGGAVDDEIE